MAYRKGHNMVGRQHRLGHTNSPEHQARINEGRARFYEGKRQRDLDPTGPGVYSTKAYKEARQQLVVGKPCQQCGSTEHVHAHHQTAGDDSTLIPLCRSCHASHHHSRNTTKRMVPGETAPLCACGCGRQVAWKRVRGWAQFCKGHGNRKIQPKSGEAPLCACGCGLPVLWKDGVGWRKIRRGHSLVKAGLRLPS